MGGEDLVVFFAVGAGLREEAFGDDEVEGDAVGLTGFEDVVFGEEVVGEWLGEAEEIVEGLGPAGSGGCCSDLLDVRPRGALEGDLDIGEKEIGRRSDGDDAFDLIQRRVGWDEGMLLVIVESDVDDRLVLGDETCKAASPPIV